MSAVRLPKFSTAQKEYLRELLGESIHVSFRKGSDHPKAGEIWKLIHDLPRKDWTNVVDNVMFCLFYEGKS